jgi:hypothetical protein
MWNGRFKIQVLKWLKKIRKHSAVHNSYYLIASKHIAENHLRFQGYVPVSPYISMDGCT